MYEIVLDPHEVADAGRVELDLNSGPIRVDQAGIDWGDAAIQAYMADLSVGSVAVDYRLPNRTVTIPLGLGMDDSGQAGFDAARQALNQKVALIQREGGWLKRTSNVGPLYADVVSATLTEPDRWGEAGAVEPDVKLVLECLPDFYGDEVDLGALAQSPVTFTTIEGDHPGRVRIRVTDLSGDDQQGLLWGFRSRGVPSTLSNAFYFDGSDLTEITPGSTGAGATLISGTWLPVVSTTLSADGSEMTHTGAYRVWARCYSTNAAPRVRLVWAIGDLARPEENDAVALPRGGNDFLLDLGSVYLREAPVGTHRWKGVIQAYGDTSADTFTLTELFLQPIGETAGRLISNPADSVAGAVSSAAAPATVVDATGTGTVAWSNPAGATTEFDSSVATASVNASDSHYLKATGFGFAIPATATVIGIAAWVVRACAAGNIGDRKVRLVRAGTVEATDRAAILPWPTAWAGMSYGGSTDLWGAAWTPSDINNAGFGFALSAGSNVSDTADVDFIRLTVYYTIGSGFVSEDAVIFANRTAEISTDGCYRDDSAGSGNYGAVSVFVGDLPRIPPSGPEGLGIELVVRPTVGNFDDLPDSSVVASTQVLYRPCYIARV